MSAMGIKSSINFFAKSEKCLLILQSLTRLSIPFVLGAVGVYGDSETAEQSSYLVFLQELNEAKVATVLKAVEVN
jgi:hypothetical protein